MVVLMCRCKNHFTLIVVDDVVVVVDFVIDVGGVVGGCVETELIPW
jgi:hypothetical protein